MFLNEVLTEFLDDIPLAAIQGLWFQHDGAPAHFCAPVRGWLDMEYPGRWIGQGSGSMAAKFARSYTVRFFSYETVSRNWCIERRSNTGWT
ncbi:hypothetical protein AVEN_151177-1 [Araneus ventricosus]|uniref:Uncharacterized protein n=1 Tax=Araneus ventricosus TaxID=182803 RepID=A0A4Y2PZP8_ARAVE|nr:hypothetical protein AVEN_151177-1 [Araneus ventricosus]